jgi:hypothetical protein
VRFLADAIGHVIRREGVWTATGSEIIDWYRTEMAKRGGAGGRLMSFAALAECNNKLQRKT